VGAAFRRRRRPRDGSPACTRTLAPTPVSWRCTATTARGVARANGKRSQTDRTELTTWLRQSPGPAVAHRGPAPGAGSRWAGRGFSWPGPDPALEREPSRDPDWRRGRDAHPQTPAGERPKARLNKPNRHALGRSE
jgi:hypothetical protein